MLTSYQLGSILKDERITQGLSDPDGRCLVERLVEIADALAVQNSGASLVNALQILSRKGRLVARIVRLWSLGDRPSAIQLAASGGLGEFIPSPTANEESLIDALLPA
jgi:hypothetical protein